MNRWISSLFSPPRYLPVVLITLAPLSMANAQDDALTTPINVPLVISSQELLANDSDGQSLQITYVDDWNNGILAADLAAGTMTFTPTDFFTGEASFIYGAQNPQGDKSYAKVTISVTASTSPNEPPTAVKDHFNTTKNMPLELHVSQLLSNDSDPDADDELGVVYLDDEKQGTLQYNQQHGTLVFTPDLDFVGEATFVYAIRDLQAETAYASVFVNVIDDTSAKAVPVEGEAGKLFFVGNQSALTFSMQSMLSNINTDFGFNGDYDYQLGGFLFPLWGDQHSKDGFIPSGNAGYASHNGVVYNSPEGLSSGEYNTLIITDGGNAIPHMWGNSSQYVSRFADYLHDHNANAQSYFLQSWPFIDNENLIEWRQQIDAQLPRWNKVINTVNGDNTPSIDSDSLYFIAPEDTLATDAKRIKLIPAGLALARLYDQYQTGNLPPNGRDFISEAFKSPDFSINGADNGKANIGHLSPEGEYLVALVIHTAIQGRSPLLASNNIDFNHRGWNGYSDKLFPETPYPESGLIDPTKAAYYQQLALDVVTEFYGWDAASLPVRIDSDGDGVGDDQDAFPLDPTETSDTDGDGVGDNSDAFPNDDSETTDTDGDGVGDNSDAFPNDDSETTDTDGDGTGDNSDVFPNDDSETTDTDGDGVGDNSDAYPNDPTRSVAGPVGGVSPSNTFVIGHSLTSNSMLSMLSNISTGFNQSFDYDYQLVAGGFLFGQWGDVLNYNTGEFEPGDGTPLAYNDTEGFPSGEYDTLILTDNWDTIPHGWGNTSQYLARFADYFYDNNNAGQTYFLQNWPSLQNENLNDWRAQIANDWPIWQQVVDTVNGDQAVSDVSDSLFYIPVAEQLDSNARRVKIIPAGLALARVYDEYQAGNLPPEGRSFISELFKYPDLTLRGDESQSGTEVIGHLSPEGEYFVALVVYASIYGESPVNASTDIHFNGRGWGGYGLDLFPQTPYPVPAAMHAAKAAYYQDLAWQVVTEFYGWDYQHVASTLIDSDGDGIVDELDAYPNDPNEAIDSDGDGVADNSDAFPNDSSETLDSDGDGIGDNADSTPNGGAEPLPPYVKLSSINFVNIGDDNGSPRLFWGDANAISYRLLLLRGNQSPLEILTSTNEYTFTDPSQLQGISTLIIEAFDSLGNSVFSAPVNVENL